MKKKTVLDYFGSGRGAISRTAKALGISTAAVSKWPDDVPLRSAYLLCRKFPPLDEIDRVECRRKVDCEQDSQSGSLTLGDTTILTTGNMNGQQIKLRG